MKIVEKYLVKYMYFFIIRLWTLCIFLYGYVSLIKLGHFLIPQYSPPTFCLGVMQSLKRKKQKGHSLEALQLRSHFYYKIYTRSKNSAVQSTGAVEYFNCNECPDGDTKKSDDEAPVLEVWRVWSTSSLPSLPGPLWPGVVVPDRVLSIGQIELFDI